MFLEVRILNELWARFAEVRILMDLVASEPSEFGVIERRAARAEKSENRFQVQEVAHPLCDGKRSESLERKGVACVAVCRACTDRCWRGRGLIWINIAKRIRTNIRIEPKWERWFGSDVFRLALNVKSRAALRIRTPRLHPHLGRARAEPGIRELVIEGTAYSILHRVRGRSGS